MYKSACRIAPCAWLTGFQKGIPLCSMGVFSGGVPLRQENALLSYGFSVQNSHWSRNRLHAQGCASLPRWNSPLNRLYLVYRLFGFSLCTDSRSSRCTHCTSGRHPSHDSRGQSRWHALPSALLHRCRADN